MASDDDDMDLDALRSAVLATLKTRNSQNASPQFDRHPPQRDTDIEGLRIAALRSRPPDVPVKHFHQFGNRRGYGHQKQLFNQNPNCGNRQLHGNTRTSNLIVIQPVAIGDSIKCEAVATSSPAKSAFLGRPQDRYCRSTEDEASQSPSTQRAKRADKFSRFESDTESDSDDDDFLGKSDETNNEDSSTADEDTANGQIVDGDDYEEITNDADLVDQLHSDERLVVGEEEEQQQLAEEDGEDEEDEPLEEVHELDESNPISPSNSQPDDEDFRRIHDDENQQQPSPDVAFSQRTRQQHSNRSSNRPSHSDRDSDSAVSNNNHHRKGDSRGRFGERSSSGSNSNNKDIFGKEIANARLAAGERQRALRGERFGVATSMRVEQRRSEHRTIREENNQRGAPARARTRKLSASSRQSADHTNHRRRANSPITMPLTSSSSIIGRKNGERSDTPFAAAESTKKSRSSRESRGAPTKSRRGDGDEPLNDLREKLKSRNREEETPQETEILQPRKGNFATVDERPSGGERQRRRRKAAEVASPTRDLSSRLAQRRERERDRSPRHLPPEGHLRERSRSPARRTLQSIVKLRGGRSAGTRSLGDSPVRSPVRGDGGIDGGGNSQLSVDGEVTASKRGRSPAFGDGDGAEMNPRKVLIVKANDKGTNYLGDDVLSSRHRFNVTLTEAPDLPDSDSSTNNRLPIHSRLGHFAKSSTASAAFSTFDAAGAVVTAPESSSRHGSRSSSERKSAPTSQSSSRHKKKKSRSNRERPARHEASPPRQVKLKRESLLTSSSSTSQSHHSTNANASSRLGPSSNGFTSSSSSSKRSHKQSGKTYESELDEKIRRIKEVNEAILKRKSEIEKDQQANY